MTLQMNYQEKYEQGYDEGDRKRATLVAMNMLQANKLSLEEIALYSGLTLEQVLELEKELIEYEAYEQNKSRTCGGA